MRKFLWAFLILPFIGCDAADIVSLDDQPSARASHDGQSGPIRVYFTQPDRSAKDAPIIDALVGYIAQAQTSIDVCAFELDNQRITEALLAAKQRGVKVRLVTDTDYLEESGVTRLRQAGVPVVDDSRPGSLMHNKFMVFDNRSVWTGSMNFTENGAYKNNNHGVFIDDARIAANYATKFRWMFEQRKFGGAPSRSAKIPHPVVTLSDGTKIENYFSTHDHIADRLIAKIRQARKSIHFLAFSFTHDGIGKAMLERAKAGVEVKGVFEKTQTGGRYTEFHRMKKAGLPVFVDANRRNMHHKVIIIDGQITVAGSYNFSASADKSNDENVVIIHSPRIAALFEAEFQRVYGAAERAASTTALAR
ncbi:MAG: phospholipase [Gemmatales bacterium]|nr:MAG: phospholipase [Gemmatales bacterium]